MSFADHRQAARCPPARRRRAAPRRGRPLRDPRSGRARARPRRRAGRAAGTTRRAVAGCASAFASATPYASTGLLLRAAPDDARIRRRPLLEERRTCAAPPRAASPRGPGSATASGIPGEPPPEPTSTIGPSQRRTTSGARNASSTQHRVRLLLVAKRGQPGRREQTARSQSAQEGRRRSDSAPPLPRPSRRPRRPAASGARPCARRPSSGRARHAPRSYAPAAPFAPRATPASRAGARDSPRRRRSLPSAPRRTHDARSRSCRYCTASIVCPWRPISSATSAPEHVSVIASSSSCTSRRPPTPSAFTTRAISKRASLATSLSSSETASAASAGRCATTRAGMYPTPSRPRSPSVTTSKRTADLSSAGCRCSSSRSAAHFASPTVSPVASTVSSSLTAGRRPSSGAPCAAAAATAPAQASAARGSSRTVAAPVTVVTWRRSRALLLEERRRGRLRHQPPRDQPLPDRPEVRRHPVENETRREARDHEDEHERHEHEDRALRLVRGRRHVERRRHLDCRRTRRAARSRPSGDVV